MSVRIVCDKGRFEKKNHVIFSNRDLSSNDMKETGGVQESDKGGKNFKST